MIQDLIDDHAMSATPRDVAALVLATGLVVALNVLAIAVLWSTIHGRDAIASSTNELLTGWGSGIATGVLGVLVGFRVARSGPGPRMNIAAALLLFI